jgi:nicotinate-nucleotide pyrophosphorylase (carboxylating)
LAVLHGGGCNHRFGLYDMVLIKDTHAAAAGGVAPAIRRVRASGAAAGLKVEVEVQSVDEFMAAAAERPDRIMLDNMDAESIARCVVHARSHAPGMELEASGNVTLQSVRAIAETGVDYISAGCITHSALALDIHLVITERPVPTTVS